jgi:hypothetical protein
MAYLHQILVVQKLSNLPFRQPGISIAPGAIYFKPILENSRTQVDARFSWRQTTLTDEFLEP